MINRFMLRATLVTMAWRVLGLRMGEAPANMEFN
jgi:hypothetical protein